MILSLYNKLVKLNPTSVKTIRTDNTCADYNYIHILNRKQYKSVKMIEDKYDDLFFVRLYCFCRFREEKLQLNQYEFNKIVLDAQKIYKYQSEEACLNYIWNFTKVKPNEKTLPLTSDDETGKILATLKKDQIRPTFKF